MVLRSCAPGGPSLSHHEIPSQSCAAPQCSGVAVGGEAGVQEACAWVARVPSVCIHLSGLGSVHDEAGTGHPHGTVRPWGSCVPGLSCKGRLPPHPLPELPSLSLSLSMWRTGSLCAGHSVKLFMYAIPSEICSILAGQITDVLAGKEPSPFIFTFRAALGGVADDLGNAGSTR